LKKESCKDNLHIFVQINNHEAGKDCKPESSAFARKL